MNFEPQYGMSMTGATQRQRVRSGERQQRDYVASAGFVPDPYNDHTPAVDPRKRGIPLGSGQMYNRGQAYGTGGLGGVIGGSGPYGGNRVYPPRYEGNPVSNPSRGVRHGGQRAGGPRTDYLSHWRGYGGSSGNGYGYM